MDLKDHQGLSDDEAFIERGIYPPGTELTVDTQAVVVQKLLAQGGKAHVYTVEVPALNQVAVLKRTAAADLAELQILNQEVNILRTLPSHSNTIGFLAAASAPLPDSPGFELLILLEYCSAGNLVELLNRRMHKRLEESEILRIFSHICQAVAHLHYQDPPIIHRDLKPENILISSNHTRFVLCDFGSCTRERIRGGTQLTRKQVGDLEEDVQLNTTLEYRAPELIDLYLKYGLTEKIDIWALGVLFYKLCYLVTPFEETGELAILNGRYQFPDSPVYSEDTCSLIRWMLQEDPRDRPDIFQLTE
ncbi:kinase-like domain-containing protein, partial [Dimargaris cristalligena]